MKRYNTTSYGYYFQSSQLGEWFSQPFSFEHIGWSLVVGSVTVACVSRVASVGGWHCGGGSTAEGHWRCQWCLGWGWCWGPVPPGYSGRRVRPPAQWATPCVRSCLLAPPPSGSGYPPRHRCGKAGDCGLREEREKSMRERVIKNAWIWSYCSEQGFTRFAQRIVTVQIFAYSAITDTVEMTLICANNNWPQARLAKACSITDIISQFQLPW